MKPSLNMFSREGINKKKEHDVDGTVCFKYYIYSSANKHVVINITDGIACFIDSIFTHILQFF